MSEIPDLLRRLVAEAEAEVARRRREVTEDQLAERAAAQPPARDLAAALDGESLAVIAEMKSRTPILGRLRGDYRPGELARAYEAAGAAALSVLCQETSFGGTPTHLAEARAASTLPILRKDFVVSEHQVLEARALGGDSVLLIVAALKRARLETLLGLARSFGMEPLVEVHDRSDVEGALGAGARVVGVNHRDLTTFQVDLGLTERLRPLLPPGVRCVAESGIATAADARRLRQAGADAVLVGEALMRSADPGAVIRELRQA